jgi:CRISPR-associated exonuclease Cas4
MQLTATHINYYHVCKRKLWLFASGINMEHTSDTVAEGKLTHETAYPQRPEKYTEVEIGGSKIDFYDAKNKVIHEVKKSDSIEAAHEWQVKYYIWLLEQQGVEGVSGIIEYPKLRHTSHVELSAADALYLQEVMQNIQKILSDEKCPPCINSKICRQCAYYDFCYIEG